MILLFIYNDRVTPGMKINSLSCFIMCCTPNYSGTPFKKFGTPLSVQHIWLKSTDIETE